MLREWLNKLKDPSGETLVEVLVAVLISGLGMLMLAMAVSVSAHLIERGGSAAQNYYETSNALAAVSDSAGAAETRGKITVSSTIPAIPESDEQVYYVMEELPGGEVAISYTYHGTEASGE